MFTPEDTLKVITHLMVIGLRQGQCMRNGFTIVTNLMGTNYGSLDHKMHKYLLQNLQDNFPARVNQILIVNPNWYFLGGGGTFG